MGTALARQFQGFYCIASAQLQPQQHCTKSQPPSHSRLDCLFNPVKLLYRTSYQILKLHYLFHSLQIRSQEIIGESPGGHEQVKYPYAWVKENLAWEYCISGELRI
ncbi:hypothetical protein G7K_3958-t1 [Saitoella complicata NRRL Y-17804]|uniref:Uncharacterized protein n=1 Tax=Saitoella complicata (strain BCRC 22490 / CBS 7301 / JCM 7358 / NBRC 10748 / NRRL Y-17804) TaxID=698492 RepID=A0A0E9NK93_SAICN|nr:hypothetical protein G7K_3958-t1 [Saitoella complicata NRRL Y-17804]